MEAALPRVLSSRAFRGSPRLRRFLAHVVRHGLAGEEDRVKEYTIGVEVFDRGPRVDPRIDAMVRVEALKFRQKLALAWQARFLLLQCTPRAIARAQRYLTYAAERWPARPDVHAALAGATLTAIDMEVVSSAVGAPLLRRGASRALALDPGRSDTRFYLAVPDVHCLPPSDVMAYALVFPAPSPTPAAACA